MTVPALVPHRSVSDTALYEPKQVALIRRSMAKDANDDEFAIFLQMCRALRLDPLRRQVYCFVYNKDDAKKRQMVLVTSIGGFRTIADRTGNYRPDEEAPVFHILPWKVDRDTALIEVRRKAAEQPDLVVRRAWLFDQMQALDELYPIDPLNPEGIEKAVVRVFKFSHGEWHTVTEEAYWTERAPIKEEWGYDEASGKRKPTGRQVLDTLGQWGKMPRVMLAKVCEAAALRKAWPDDFANVQAEEEVDRQKYIDLTAVELADLGTQQARLERVQPAKDCLLISWTGSPSEAPEEVPAGALPDRAFAFIEDHRDNPQAIADWQTRNRFSLRTFFALHKNDALEIKRRIEAATAPVAA